MCNFLSAPLHLSSEQFFVFPYALCWFQHLLNTSHQSNETNEEVYATFRCFRNLKQRNERDLFTDQIWFDWVESEPFSYKRLIFWYENTFICTRIALLTEYFPGTYIGWLWLLGRLPCDEFPRCPTRCCGLRSAHAATRAFSRPLSTSLNGASSNSQYTDANPSKCPLCPSWKRDC